MSDKSTARDGGGVRSAGQPVAQARKKINFRFIRSEIDKPFFILVLVLLVFGIIMMFSASYAWGLSEHNDGYHYVKKQIFAGVLGLAAMFAVSFLDYHFFQNTKVAYIIFSATWLLTLYTAFFGVETADARRWIYIGPLQLQPSELLKVGFIIIFAYIMSVNFPKFKDWRYCVLPFTIILGMVAAVLVLQRHMSAVLLVGIIGVTMMFVSGMPRKTFWIFIACVGAAGILLVLYKIFATGDFNYILDRFKSWQDPTSDTSDTTLQTYQSILAIGSGGLFGLGFGESRQKYLYLPESQNDFVFSVVCEELGFIGAMVVIILFLMFIIRGFYIGSRAKDRFGMLLAAGITIQIGSQALLNIAVASNAFPNTGISLPFFSYGGTALLIQLAEMGILLNISRQARTPK
ncbi:FtsW/RodA/SpoVE family cell cycle protein [Ruminococcus sp. Marseille-P6503]|uniref:FtsW/RodA/SpoVE family cell cycle protein n=1 Tax=Ruminococcus sp. Marseille-P6503 TaxID=2364796 RepID=UPI000F51BDC5|nr:FtsW/RodA/SpoVE family cell cycle protein [Ruminococcus sp. Marseille-P6503]